MQDALPSNVLLRRYSPAPAEAGTLSLQPWAFPSRLRSFGRSLRTRLAIGRASLERSRSLLRARRGLSVDLTWDPYGIQETAGITRALLHDLLAFSELAIRLRTSSPAVAGDAELLAVLDTTNTVTVELITSGAIPDSLFTTARLLSAQGLSVQLLGEAWALRSTRATLARAREAGIQDVRLQGMSLHQRALVQAYGFPRALPSRG